MKKILLCLFVSIALVSAVAMSETAIKETYLVPMRDGVRLSTDVYRPNDASAHPVILYRTPYDKASDHLSDTIVGLLNIWGYAFIAQDCRGRFASEGVDSVFFTDGWGALRDGYDTIEWVSHQPWCNGKVAIVGGSATGITSYRAAGSLHPNLKCVIAIVAPSDFYHQVVYPGGEFRKEICENWIRDQGSDYMIDFFMQFPYYTDMWDMMNLHTRTAMMTVPILHVGGWYDCFSDGTVQAFQDLRRQPQAGTQKLLMGPWKHGSSFGENVPVGGITYPSSNYDLVSYVLQWLDYWMRDVQNGVLNRPDVIYYLMGDPAKTDEGGCQWLSDNFWPPDSAQDAHFYFDGTGRLAPERPTTVWRIDYDYDPLNPVPTVGGNNLTIAAGPFDQRVIGSRNDILSFTMDVNAAPIRVEGVVQANLTVQSNRPDTDFTLKLIDVYPDGREMLVTDGIARARFRHGYHESKVALLDPAEPVVVSIKLPPTAIVFNTGHKIKVCVSSSNYPRFEVNPNTGNFPNDRSNPLRAQNTLFVGDVDSTVLILPVVGKLTRVAEKPSDLPVTARLLTNFPNPFNGKTTIRYRLTETGDITLAIYNMAGQKVRALFDGRQGAGEHFAHWDGLDDSGLPAASGIYWYRLSTPTGLETRKMAMVK